MIDSSMPDPLPGPVETAAWFAAGQPGMPDRLLSGHTRREDGDCAGCGTYRPTEWPCVLVHIGRLAKQINGERNPPSARPDPSWQDRRHRAARRRRSCPPHHE